MTRKTPDGHPPKRRSFKWGQAFLGTILLLSVVCTAWYLRSNAFRELIRRKVVAELELVTGGRVEIQSLTLNLIRLQFDAQGVTIYGREGKEQAPWLHMDRIAGQAKIISFFAREIGLRSLVVDHPVIHLVLNPDGSTNQPLPKIHAEDNSPVQPLFDLAINQLEINGAELLVNDQSIHFDFSGSHLSAGMSYSKADKAYAGNLNAEMVAARYQALEPLRGRLDLNFVLHPTRLEIQAFKFATGHSTLAATGTLANYSHPEANFTCQASLDVAEVGRMVKISHVQGGRLEIDGTGSYRNQWYEAQGSVAGYDVSWREAGWNFGNLDLASPFLFTADKLSLSALKIKALGGGAQGSLEIAHWNSPASAGKTQTPLRGTVKLHLSGVQVAQAAAALSTRRLPLNRMNLAGAISGELNSSWTGSRSNAATEFKLEAEPAVNPTPHQLPLTGNLQATYHHGSEVMDVTGLSAATRGIRLNATGTLGSETAQLKLAFNANDLAELQPVLAAWSSDAQVPLEVRGRVSFNGTISGKLTAISARGRLDLEDFDTMLGPVHALVAQNVPGRIHWDAMLADIVITPSIAGAQNGLLKRGAAQLVFSGSASLEHGVFNSRTSQFTANLQVQNGSLGDTLSLAGYNYPLTGTLNGSVHAAGTLNNLRGSGSITATRLTIYGEPFTQLRSNINFAGRETQFNNLVLTHNGAQITGSAAINSLSGEFRFDLTGNQIELASLKRLTPQRFSLGGRAGFHASGSGTADAPQINAQLNVQKLVVNGEVVGDLNASAETHGENMLLRATTNFQNAALSIDGSMRLRDNFPAQMTLKFDHLDFDPLIRAYLKASTSGHSYMAGYVELRGPIKTPETLSIGVNISQLSASVQNIKVQNAGPLRFSLNKLALHIDQFHLTGDNTDISLRGDADLGGSQELDMHADGRIDLKLLQTLDPNVTSSGAATVTAHLAGTRSQPEMRGRMEISNGAISAVDVPNGLTQINGRLVFAQDRMEIENLKAHTGGGDLDLAGFIAYHNGLYFDVTATSSDVRVRYPPGLSASANANLRYTGSAEASLLSGDATIVRLAVDPRFDFAQYLAFAKNGGKTATQNPFLDNLRLDVHIVSMPELRVETSLAKVSGDADIHIRGTAANPAILGRVTIAQGDVSFNGARYHLERGEVTFNNPQKIQPIINVEMTARVRDYDITIGFHGPVDRLNITYRSEPPLASSDIIALLAFGRTKQQDIYSNQPTTTLTTSDTILEQALTTTSSSRVQKLFGVGSVKIDPQVIGAENNLGPRVTIEQQIQNNITLTYVTNVAQSTSEQVIQVEYNLTKSISVVAVRDQNGILAFEIRMQKRKR